MSLATFKIYTNADGWWDRGLVPILIATFVPFFIIMPAGPLIYFYTKSCVDPQFALGKRDRIHFLPVLLDLAPMLTAILYVVLLAVGQQHSENGTRWGAFIDTYNVYVDIPRWISMTLYVAAAWQMLRNAETVEVTRWPRQFLLGFMVFLGIWLLHLIPYELPFSGDWLMDHVGWYPLYIPLVVLCYWLGIRGYLLSQTWPVAPAPLSKSVAQPAALRLEQLMVSEKIFLDAGLNLSRLAKRVGVAPKTLSAVLNQHMRKSFSEYVNEYRVREVQGRLLDGETREMTIAGLAYEAGFNSLQTFQRAFKAVSGVTPSEFLVKARRHTP
jgi:AraC-like DNA-binding protein